MQIKKIKKEVSTEELDIPPTEREDEDTHEYKKRQLITDDHEKKEPMVLIGSKFGRYVIQEKLGKGGRGLIFKVMDTLTNQTKAIKMIPLQITPSHFALKELKKELNIASNIIHPNVVKIFGLEEHNGQYFIVMEYIDGISIEEILASSNDGKLEEIKVIPIMKKLVQGLNEIHKKKVIHRDIKPSNIMLTKEEEVKILDFGISYQVTESMHELQKEHLISGTLPYMAPEQLSTRFGRQNEQVDIWGFGVTMYQLLSGKFPFINKDQIKDKNEKPYELKGVSKLTRNIVIRCLEKDRRKRFGNMKEVIKALEKIGVHNPELSDHRFRSYSTTDSDSVVH